MIHRPIKAGTCLLALLAALLVGCGDDGGSGPSSDSGQRTEMRIVSLAPALTQMLIDMNVGGRVVGVAEHDNAVAVYITTLKQTRQDNEQKIAELRVALQNATDPSTATQAQAEVDRLAKLNGQIGAEVSRLESLPVVGNFLNIDTEALVALKPTHVLVMTGKEGVPSSLEDLGRANDFKVIAYPYPTSVRDVIGILMGSFVPSADPGAAQIAGNKSLAAMLGDESSGFFLNSYIVKRLGKISVLTSDYLKTLNKKPRVLLVIGTEPQIRASGPNTVLHDLLSQYVGGYNAAIPDLKPPPQSVAIDPVKLREWENKDPAKDVGQQPTFDKEQLLEAKPDVILLLMPGEPPLRSVDEDPRLADLRGLDIPAVKNNRIVLIDDLLVQLPSSSLAVVAAEMTKAVYPQLSERVDKLMQEEGAADSPASKSTPTANASTAPGTVQPTP